MRMIDADALEKSGWWLIRDNRNQSIAQTYETKAIDAVLTVDAVSVVRCRECKCYPKNFDKGSWNWCLGIGNYTKPNDFCSYGHRREEEHNATN